MEFRVLGPFEAHHGGERIEVGSRRQERCLLAILLLDAGKLIPIDRLIELLWTGDPPRSARGVVHTYIGRLRGYLDLADEQTVTSLIEQAARRPGEAAAILDEARVLRRRLYAYLTNPDDRRAFAVVARFVEAAAKMSVFARDSAGLGRWTLSREAGLRLPVHAAARAAADLLADPRRFTVRACPGEHCGWLFLDQSGLRRYCSVATCGKQSSSAVVCAS